MQVEREMSFDVATILRRTRQIISAAVRSYESSGSIEHGPLNLAKTNLRRISIQISVATFDKLEEALNALLSIPITNSQEQRCYLAPRISANGNQSFISLFMSGLYNIYQHILN